MTCPRLDSAQAAARLNLGGVLILPTDTLPGFHARADRPSAVSRIRALKGRSLHKPLVVLAGSIKQAWDILGPLTAFRQQFCTGCWPGPFTLILPGEGQTAAGVESSAGTLAVRVPDDPALCTLILAVGFPLVSTSVNREGDEPARSLPEAVQAFGLKVDGFWSGGEAPPSGTGLPSALVDLTGPEPRVVRPGPVPFPI